MNNIVNDLVNKTLIDFIVFRFYSLLRCFSQWINVILNPQTRARPHFHLTLNYNFTLIDLVVLKSVSYTAAAIGVCVWEG